MDISKFHDRCVFICTEEEKIYKLLADNDIDDKIEDTTNFYKDGKLSQKIFKLKTLISDLEEYSEYFRDTSYRYKIIRIQGELKLLEILNNQCLHFSVVKKVLVNDIYKDLYSKFKIIINVKEEIKHESLTNRLVKLLISKKSKNIYLTHNDLAFELDSAREVVSRKLKELEQKGYLKLSRGKIQIEKDLNEIIN